MRGQTTMVAIAFGIIMMVALLMFLLASTLQTMPGESLKLEYGRLYANNLLLSLERTDTDCGPFAGVLKAAYFGGGKCDIDGFVAKSLPDHVDGVLNATGHTEFEWYLEASPINFQGEDLAFGNPSAKEPGDRHDSRTTITWEGYRLELKIYVKTK